MTKTAMNITDQKLKDVLIKEKYVSEENLKKAEQYAFEKHLPLTNYLIENKLLNKDLLGQAIAEAYSVRYSDLNSNPPSKDQVLRIPEDLARKFRITLFEESDDKVILATDNPKKAILDIELKMLFKPKEIEITYSLPEDIDEVFMYYTKELQTRFQEIIKTGTRIAPEILNVIIDDAITNRISDIHFEPQKEDVVIRFRLDGVLYELARIQHQYYESILNRIKIQAHMRIDDHFAAQDGAIRYENNGKICNIRVSILPTLDGEKVAMRLLSEYIKNLTINDLGLSTEDAKNVLASSKKPFGMILVTGPTGSGKTTTLYSLLSTLNTKEVNITTIEDPVEYKIPGVNQIQVNTYTNLTFAQGLRSIVRQDPNIILVGEIRDDDTAQIAVNAALTGHLLLSTFHANDAATAIPRLLEMNVEPFLLSSTLDVIIAQRLVRRVCEKCIYSYKLSAKDLEEIHPELTEYFDKSENTFYKGKGCNVCGNKGYKGRIAIYEIIYTNEELKEAILTNPSSKNIWEIAQRHGSKPLFIDGMSKVKTGLTTLEELMRVAPLPSGKKTVLTKKLTKKKS